MNGVRLSVFAWAVYVLAIGAAFLLATDPLLDLFGIDKSDEVWPRVLGVVLLVLGIYYVGASLHTARWMFWYSVFARIGSGVAIAFLAAQKGPWQLWIFAAIEVLGAGWTFSALRWKPPVDPALPAEAA